MNHNTHEAVFSISLALLFFYFITKIRHAIIVVENTN